MKRVRRILRLCLALACTPAFAPAWAAQDFDTTAGNLLVVLRETPGANKQNAELQPMGKVKTKLPDGRDVEYDTSWFAYLGDIHLRLVFDGERQVQSASPDDLQRLQLTPEQALALAVDNLRQRYGAPVAEPWGGGLMQVRGRAPELNSSYLLDRSFWQALLQRHPEGLVVAVPRRGGLVFAPANDDVALLNLRFSAAALYAQDNRNRLSSALYLFKDGCWSVYQPPQAQPH